MSQNAADRDRTYMKKALSLAAKGSGHTSPNPMVGAVVVQGESIVGAGYHERVGGPHAEVNALREAGSRAAGGTLYVTLEPCNHYGRTPPCSLAVYEAGIARVVVGMGDPNPHVEGRGSDFLRSRGVEVASGVLEAECRRMNQAFLKHVTTGLPYVVLKAAATLDGRIATQSGDSRWISNERSRRFVHRLRCSLDAILVGINTALRDDPQLTARIRKTPPCRQPVRIVLDSHLRLDPDSQLARTARETPLWIACGEAAPEEKARRLIDRGAQILRLPSREDRVDLRSLLEELGKRQVTSLLVEGGAHVHGDFLESRLADGFYFFYAPKILADPCGLGMVCGGARDHMAEALSVFDLRVNRFGGDVMLSGRLHEHLF